MIWLPMRLGSKFRMAIRWGALFGRPARDLGDAGDTAQYIPHYRMKLVQSGQQVLGRPTPKDYMGSGDLKWFATFLDGHPHCGALDRINGVLHLRR